MALFFATTIPAEMLLSYSGTDIVSLLLLIGILTLPVVQAKKSKSPQEWAGHKINEVIEKFGSPTTVYDGGPQKVYAWQFSHTITNPGNGDVITVDRYRMF